MDRRGRPILNAVMKGARGAVLGVFALAFLLCSGNDADDPSKMQFEAAFQGKNQEFLPLFQCSSSVTMPGRLVSNFSDTY